MNFSDKSKWIWINDIPTDDSYGEFYSEFEYVEGEVSLLISADSNYTVYINGNFVDSVQYSDFPHYKIYDELNITEFCTPGENKVGIVVWYYGEANSSYYSSTASLKFEIINGDKILSYSNEDVLSRLSRAFVSGHKKIISPQLGFTFSYDATKEDNWLSGNLSGFDKSVVCSYNPSLFPRKIKKTKVLSRSDSSLIKSSDNYYLFDLKKEEVGFLTLRLKSSCKQTLTICFGEHIEDGKVRQIIGNRDFSVTLTIGEGITEYINYFRRLGLRYLEVHSEDKLEIDYVSLLPCHYPLEVINRSFENPLHQKIYDISVRTLQLCMHDHYEDCPWREQALYVMDGRNQMLCGYLAFREYEFPRENLYLMSKDNRSDGLLSITFPTSRDFCIPSFSLHYFMAIYEYTKYSGDLTLAEEIYPKLTSIMDAFLKQISNGIAYNFIGKSYWNFYEWMDGLSGNLGGDEPQNVADAALNCLLSLSLSYLQKICRLIGKSADYTKTVFELNKNIKSVFFDEKTGLYKNSTINSRYSELVNSLAVLCAASTGKEAEKICEILTEDNNLTKVSLSMACFKYDALIKVNEAKYSNYIINSIEEKYKPMLDFGATSFWETEKGESDFDNAGSLCHGWSAMPVYYLSKLKEK